MANGLVTASQFQLTPDIAGSAGRGLRLGEQIRQVRQRPEIEDLRRRALAGDVQASQELASIAPEAAQNIQTFQANTFANLDARNKTRVSSVVTAAAQVKALPTIEAKINFLENREREIIQSGLDPSDTRSTIDLYRSGRIEEANDLVNQTVQLGENLGIIKAPGTGRDVALKAFQPVTLINPKTKEKRLVSPTVDPNTGKAILQPFDIPEGFEVSTETSKEKRAADVLADVEKERGKKKVALEFGPQIEKAIIAARSLATERGEVFNELSQAKAALPSLNRAVDELKELSVIATSTFGGKLFDAAVKETGFGATKGSTARAKFIAIVNNQVLPLLKPTFGGSFSVQEGESLKATMGDPDASPAEKMVQLEAFITQKLSAIETRQAQLGDATQVIEFDRTGKRIN